MKKTIKKDKMVEKIRAAQDARPKCPSYEPEVCADCAIVYLLSKIPTPEK